MDKQIKEMAEAIFQNCNCGIFYSEAERIADFVINRQGYRKASEVAEEIFAELKKVMIDEYRYPIIAELKNKYTEGEGNGRF